MRIIATILYSYVFNSKGDDDVISFLVRGFRSTSDYKKQRSCYLRLIAQQTITEYFQILDDDATTTTTIASLTQLSSSESNGINNDDTTTTTSRRQALPPISTNVENGSSNVDSPLTMPSALETATMFSKLSTRFSFTSPLKEVQKCSHDRDLGRYCEGEDDDEADGMSLCSSFLTSSPPFLPTPRQVTKRRRCTHTHTHTSFQYTE